MKYLKIINYVLLFIMLKSCSTKQNSYPLSYGYILTDQGVEFRLYAPSSDEVFLVVFDKPEDTKGVEYPMSEKPEGEWFFNLKNHGAGTMYGFRLIGPNNDSNVIVADPYSKATITQNNWRHVAKSLVVDDSFDWQGDTWLKIKSEDLIIYEAHLRDMTIHYSSNSKASGTYIGFVEEGQNGGIEHLKKLGVNAVQFLPLWDFANFEIPYKREQSGFYNDWNPYERNHWGYMPTFFMAPESYYSSSWKNELDQWNGIDGRAVSEMKTMVRELHKNGIAVIMDVVVNHVSNYDWHPLKYIDKETYFLLNEDGTYKSQCCGNLLDTDHPKVKEYILESLKYWMVNYHIDGFRFDQCYLLSAETSKQIATELKKINPNLILYGEAWGNRESEFSEMGWGSFNARFRDVLKGELHNRDVKGYLLNGFRPGEDIEDLECILSGTSSGKHPTYKSPKHSINFLEVHDNYSFNDYTRIGLNLVREEDVINNPSEFTKLNRQQMKINKLGALFLFTAQGIPLMHQGQEWARSRIVAKTNAPDSNVGKIDNNSYNKDNETNWVDWDQLKINEKLIDYYKDLIKIRKLYPQFRYADPSKVSFERYSDRSLGYFVDEEVAVIFNGNYENMINIKMPEGKWKLILDENGLDANGIKIIEGELSVDQGSGIILVKI